MIVFRKSSYVAVLVSLLLAGCAGSTLSSHPTVVQGQSGANGTQVLRPVAPNNAISQRPATQMAGMVPVGTPRRAALLLPLSGPQAAVGQSMLDAALLATQDLAPNTLELSVHDTAKGAEAAYQSARADGAQLIVGPLFSTDVMAVRTAAAQAGDATPVLALSNDTSLAGPSLYVMGFWPGAQIARVVRFAEMRGYRNFAAVVSNDAYGQAVASALQATLQAPAHLVKIVATDDPGVAAAQLASVRGQYDALLLPMGGVNLAAMLDTLAPQDLLQRAPGQNVQLLGSGLWDAPDLQQRPMLYGAWYAAPDPAARQSFTDRYQAGFGQPPVRIASLAYDATAMAAVLAARGWPYQASALTQPQGFDGVDGLFRIQQNGLVERSLAVLQLTPGGLQLVDPAARRF